MINKPNDQIRKTAATLVKWRLPNRSSGFNLSDLNLDVQFRAVLPS